MTSYPSHHLRGDATSNPTRVGRAGIAAAALAYAALAAHLLFIPYAYAPLSFDAALRRLAQIQWFELGSDQNVALVSRALMWLPLGLLLAALVTPRPRRRVEVPALLVAALLGSGWAVGVNFLQLWFPGRTFSLNNLAAEACGVIAGAALWGTLGARWLRWWRRLAGGGRTSVEAALGGYVVVYLIAILTPFDFVTSAAELVQKMDKTDLYALWIAPIGCGASSCGLKLVSVVLAGVPCGWWFASRRPKERHVWLPAALVALIVGTGIELLHFLMVSGVSQGASIVARACGMTLGAMTYPSGRRWLARVDLDRVGRPVVLALLAPYLTTVFYVGGWFRAERLGMSAGRARLDQAVWMPFYYEYYASYQATMLSAMVHTVVYAPVGVMCWLWVHDRSRVRIWLAGLLAAVLCFLVESSKVFLADRMPDYTDVFIAAISAMAVLAVLRLSSRPTAGGLANRAVPPMARRSTPSDRDE